MEVNLRDDSLLAFLREITENQYLQGIFSSSRYWKTGGEQAVKLLAYSKFEVVPNEVNTIIRNLMEDVCPEGCEAGCTIDWSQMSATLLNGDGLCDYHHNKKISLEDE